MSELFYSVEEVAEMLRVSVYTVRRWLKDGKLDGKRIGKFWRISKESVESVLPDKKKPE